MSHSSTDIHVTQLLHNTHFSLLWHFSLLQIYDNIKFYNFYLLVRLWYFWISAIQMVFSSRDAIPITSKKKEVFSLTSVHPDLRQYNWLLALINNGHPIPQKQKVIVDEFNRCSQWNRSIIVSQFFPLIFIHWTIFWWNIDLHIVTIIIKVKSYGNWTYSSTSNLCPCSWWIGSFGWNVDGNGLQIVTLRIK